MSLHLKKKKKKHTHKAHIFLFMKEHFVAKNKYRVWALVIGSNLNFNTQSVWFFSFIPNTILLTLSRDMHVLI